MRTHRKLTSHERDKIAYWYAVGERIREIARRLGRSPSSISDETATYDWPRDDKDERSAVGAACDSIRRSIREKGVSDRKTIKQISDLKSEVEGHGKEIKNQQEIIELIREALKKSLTKGELGHLINLSESPTCPTNNYQYCTFLENEMVRLCQHGYVEETFMQLFGR